MFLHTRPVCTPHSAGAQGTDLSRNSRINPSCIEPQNGGRKIGSSRLMVRQPHLVRLGNISLGLIVRMNLVQVGNQVPELGDVS